jgi:flagellar biosynthesis/type III secretory pathway protein FliH
MGSEGDKKPSVFSPRLGDDELGRILSLKERQEQQSQITAFASRYLLLGWDLAALDTGRAVELPVDFQQPQELWSFQLADFEERGMPLALAVRTGLPSNIFVVEIAAGEGDAVLDRLGQWRAECVAQGEDGLERHFYAIPQGRRVSTTSIVLDAPIKVYGEGSLIEVPLEGHSPVQEAWHWLIPPWESPPHFPPLALWHFLEDRVSGMAGTASKAEIPTWEEVFPLVASRAALLQALLAPADSPEKYYETLVHTAREEGFNDPDLLLGLLWHAPHGDPGKREENWPYLVKLATAGTHEPGEFEARVQTGPEPAVSGEPVVIERHRYEAMLAEMRKLSSRAAELEQQLAKWAQDYFHEALPAEERDPVSFGQLEGNHLGFMHDWSDLERQVAELVDNFLPDADLSEDQQEAILKSFPSFQPGALEELNDTLKKKAQQSQKEDEIEAAIQECLEENPDLAEDRRKVEMLYYCLKNYVNFHPDLMGLPLKERVAEASRMARDFLGKPLPETPAN